MNGTPGNDPRIFFAAERTLLAWIRTGVTLMAFGFVVARFGLFLDLIAYQHAAQLRYLSPTFSGIVGVLLMLAGAGTTFFAGVQHRRYVAALSAAELPSGYATRFVVVAGWIIALLGLVLAIYLTVTELVPS